MARRSLIGAVAVSMVFGLASIAAAAPPAGDVVSFLACPIARDTGPDTDLCFFAEHDGTRYGLSGPPDWGSPQLRHRVLVEGRVVRGGSVCGGLAIEGRVSVIAELDASCDQVEPFDGSVKGVAGGVFNAGTPEQRAAARDLARRAEIDPRLSVEPVFPDGPAETPPAPPFSRQHLEILYPFDSDRGSGPDMQTLMRLVRYAQAAKARVEVGAYRGASKLADGTVLTERAGMARDRAEKLAGILQGLGVARDRIGVSWVETARPADGDRSWRARRAIVDIIP